MTAIARRLLERHSKSGSPAVSECMACMLPALSQSLRDGCSVGAILATLALADIAGSSTAPPSAEEMEAHVEALCDAGERADAAALAKCFSHASSWLAFDAAQACRRLAESVPQHAARILSCFSPFSASASGIGAAAAAGGS